MAIAGLTMGILTIVSCWIPLLPWIFGLLGLIFSIAGIAKKNARAKGAAITGLILTIVGTILSIVMLAAITIPGVNKYLAAAEEAKRYAQTMQTVETN
jgi:predicted membrane protein